jgi:hypothetical protein
MLLGIISEARTIKSLILRGVMLVRTNLFEVGCTLNENCSFLKYMSEGELIFTDGSSLKGSYRILFTSSSATLKQLFFVSNSFSTEFFTREADFLRSASGEIIAKDLKKTNVSAKDQVLMVSCEFQDKG